MLVYNYPLKKIVHFAIYICFDFPKKISMYWIWEIFSSVFVWLSKTRCIVVDCFKGDNPYKCMSTAVILFKNDIIKKCNVDYSYITDDMQCSLEGVLYYDYFISKYKYVILYYKNTKTADSVILFVSW